MCCDVQDKKNHSFSILKLEMTLLLKLKVGILAHVLGVLSKVYTPMGEKIKSQA